MNYQQKIAMRSFAAIVGGYVCCIASSFSLAAIIALCFNLPKSEAVLLATNLSYFTYITFAVLAFCAKSPARAWGNVFIFFTVNSVIYVVLITGGVVKW
jgi:predicted permease